MAVFALIVSVFQLALGSYFCARLLPPLLPGKLPLIAVWLVFQLLLFLPPADLLLRGQGIHLPLLFERAGWAALGLATMSLGFLLPRDGLLLAGKLGAWITPAGSSLRQLLERGIQLLGSAGGTAALLGLILLAFFTGVHTASRFDRVKEVRVPVSDLHEDLRGLRIVQFSDLHINPFIRRRQVQQVVDRINQLEPDIILFTGDLADGTVAEMRPHAAPLADLDAPLGVWAVTGNHEYYHDLRAWVDEFPRLGMPLLFNEHRRIAVGEAELVIAGVPDVRSHRGAHDPAAALAGSEDADYRILLAHQPASILQLPRGACDLVLSGHTHGGQYYPFRGLTGRFNPYLKGLHRHQDSWIHVSTGTGFWGPPLRLGVPPEITLLQFEEKPASP